MLERTWPFAARLPTRSKGYPFEVTVDAASAATGVVLVDQIKSMNWVTRRAEPIGRAEAVTLDNVRAMLKTLLATP